jgi:inorganic phosphate transporter, PiT family
MLANLGIDVPTAILVVAAVALALSFEFVNGFHDTANAVATVIYTNTLKPTVAVVWSGLWNLIGVLTSSGAVAFGIVALLPVELVINVGSGPGFAMVFSLLVSAIVWNVGTWYLGLPASSSHTLIGSIVGVGLMNSMLSPGSNIGDGVNWHKVSETFQALVYSPIIGFVAAGLLLLLARKLIPIPALFKAPEGKQPPPWPVRLLLVLTCTGVSFAHGSNDGQKGMGLIVLILVGLLPATFAFDLTTKSEMLRQVAASAQHLDQQLTEAGVAPLTLPFEQTQRVLTTYLRTGTKVPELVPAFATINRGLSAGLAGVSSLGAVPASDRRSLRLDAYLVSETLPKLTKANALPPTVDAKEMGAFQKSLKSMTNYIPLWVKVAVACALGFGTMVGWKRIVVTVGEKIGKAHMAYAQGASAELVAFVTIGAASNLGLPVSTTHILSSGIAGTMVASGSGIQRETVRNILLAWILTLPVCVVLGAALFGASLLFMFRVLGIH